MRRTAVVNTSQSINCHHQSADDGAHARLLRNSPKTLNATFRETHGMWKRRFVRPPNSQTENGGGLESVFLYGASPWAPRISARSCVPCACARSCDQHLSRRRFDT